MRCSSNQEMPWAAFDMSTQRQLLCNCCFTTLQLCSTTAQLEIVLQQHIASTDDGWSHSKPGSLMI